jgi:hypothetical protein
MAGNDDRGRAVDCRPEVAGPGALWDHDSQVFISDMVMLRGFCRVASSVALGIVLLLVSFHYQRSLKARTSANAAQRCDDWSRYLPTLHDAIPAASSAAAKLRARPSLPSAMPGRESGVASNATVKPIPATTQARSDHASRRPPGAEGDRGAECSRTTMQIGLPNRMATNTHVPVPAFVIQPA